MGIGAILAWILFGLVVGLIARALMPGTQPMGWIGTILLGIVGSFAGGLIASVFTGSEPMSPTGWIMSIIGAIVVLLVAGALAKRRV